jgi:hypothetical protein
MTANGVEAMVNDCLKKYEGFKQSLGKTAAAAPVAAVNNNNVND